MTSMLTPKNGHGQSTGEACLKLKVLPLLFSESLKILMRAHYLLGGSVSKEDVHAYIMQDEDLLFHWDNLSDQLCHETARTLLKDIIDLWLTIRGNAFVKQAIEGHKADIYI